MEKDLQIKYSKALQEVQRERNALRAENEQLKKQLINKDNKIQVLEKQRNNYRHKRNEYRKQLKPIKQQLAEKEKEYQSFKKIADENVNYLNNRILEETRNYNQDKISFAVGQLILFKHSIEDKMKNQYVFSIENVREIFDNLIVKIREGKWNETINY